MVFRTAKYAFFHFLVDLGFFVFGHGERYPHRRHRIDRRKMGVAHIDVSTVCLKRGAGVAGHRRSDRAVRKIEFGIFYLRLSVGHSCGSGLEVTDGLVQVGLAQCFKFGQRTNTVQISLCHFVGSET